MYWYILLKYRQISENVNVILQILKNTFFYRITPVAVSALTNSIHLIWNAVQVVSDKMFLENVNFQL